MKSGLKTTEFWALFVGPIVSALRATCCPDLPEAAAVEILTYIGTIVYTVVRTWLKVKTVEKDAQVRETEIRYKVKADGTKA